MTRAAAFFRDVEIAIEEHREELDRLDAVAGDGDHGATMVMGWRAVNVAVGAAPGETDAETLRTAAHAFASVGGSIGPLWGTALLRAARTLDGTDSADPRTICSAIAAAVAGIAERGRSREGDKTLLDVVGPSSRELTRRVDGGEPLEQALAAVAEYATDRATATQDLTPRRGRARRLAGRSLGHVDPGAASAALIWRVGAEFLDGRPSAA
jgi:dihydroxyacetone kinase phosphoprotein-dependent L subunit